MTRGLEWHVLGIEVRYRHGLGSRQNTCSGAPDWSLFELFGYANEAGEVGRRHPPAVGAQPIRAAEIELTGALWWQWVAESVVE